MGYTNYGREPVYYNQGPDYDEISRYGGRPIPRYRIERESSRERFDNGAVGNSVAGNVLRMLAPQIAPAPRAAAPPPRVAAHLTSAPDHGWGTGGKAQEFRAKAQQEATQAEQLARTQPASTPYIKSGTAANRRPGWSGHETVRRAVCHRRHAGAVRHLGHARTAARRKRPATPRPRGSAHRRRRTTPLARRQLRGLSSARSRSLPRGASAWPPLRRSSSPRPSWRRRGVRSAPRRRRSPVRRHPWTRPRNLWASRFRPPAESAKRSHSPRPS